MKEPEAPAAAPPLAAERPNMWLAAVFVGLILAFQLAMTLRRDFNWDEYYFLSRIFEYRQGMMTDALQTFYVHPFSFLASLPLVDSNRLVVGRAVMLLAHLLTLFFLYRLVRGLMSEVAALWSVAFYGTFCYVLQHATSFRADPLITALLLGALCGLSQPRSSSAWLFACFLAMGFALLISIKAAMFFPVLAAVALLRLRLAKFDRRLLLRMGLAALLATAAIGLAFAWHLGGLPVTEGAVRPLQTAFEKQFVKRGPSGTLGYAYLTVLLNGAHVVLLVAGVLLAIAALWSRSSEDRRRAALVLAFASPLLFLFVYRNSFPYFYVFILAPAALAAGFAGEALQRRSRLMKYGPAILAGIGLVVMLPDLGRSQVAQRTVEAAVHQMFPKPVPYLDRCGMISSFPLANFFLSTWGLENYRASGEAAFTRIVKDRQPVFIIANHLVLRAALDPAMKVEPGTELARYALLPEDAAALRANFINHWGPIWVAGKTLEETAEAKGFEVLVAGRYTLEAASAAELDGRFVQPGEVLTLAAGPHSHRGPRTVLRYGDHLPRPATAPPEGLFEGFGAVVAAEPKGS